MCIPHAGYKNIVKFVLFGSFHGEIFPIKRVSIGKIASANPPRKLEPSLNGMNCSGMMDAASLYTFVSEIRTETKQYLFYVRMFAYAPSKLCKKAGTARDDTEVTMKHVHPDHTFHMLI